MGYAEMKNGKLTMRFPEVAPDCELRIAFHRTLRIPDDNREYPLPPSLGFFEADHVDDFRDKVPSSWLDHGGIMLPMWQSEALWMSFESPSGRPFAVKVAAGKINAVSGESWKNELSFGRAKQDYLVAPNQPWIDGFCVAEGKIRQFVAMPLGGGYTAEEQITGKAEFGGLQIIAYPMKQSKWEEKKRQEYERMKAARDSMFPYGPPHQWPSTYGPVGPWNVNEPVHLASNGLYGAVVGASTSGALRSAALPKSAEMGLAPGGAMRQKIVVDEYGFDAWDQREFTRCYVHILNSEDYFGVTGKMPKSRPLSASDYSSRGLPWFEHYGKGEALKGSETLSDLHSVAALGIKKGEKPLPENEPAMISPGKVSILGAPPGAARDGKW